jgi:CubicO group peptidase (beta-lactamase class C family)
MGELQQEVEPGEVGFDADRLARIDRHFARYVDDGRLPGWLLLVARDGRIAHLATAGWRDVEARLPVEVGTRWRIYSMTKPVTSVAAMALYELGAFELKDPVHRFIPSFRDARVYRQGSALAPVTEPVTEPVRVWHLLTHMAGLTYGFHHAHPVDAMYRAAGFEWGTPGGMDLAACCDAWASMPLLFQPGTEWNYGVSTDVLGRVLEVVTGQPLDQVLAELVLDPLGMVDTAFHVEPAHHGELAALYVANPADRTALRYDVLGDLATSPPACVSGGGGLVSTAADYHRFCLMLLREGELDGRRVLGSRTVRYMTRNHLPGGVDLEAIGRPLFAETTFSGMGFGLGFSVVDDPVANKVLSTAGEFAWGGAASTAFWVDPVERITAVFLTQLLPSSTHPIRPQLKQLVYQALVDQ